MSTILADVPQSAHGTREELVIEWIVGNEDRMNLRRVLTTARADFAVNEPDDAEAKAVRRFARELADRVMPAMSPFSRHDRLASQMAAEFADRVQWGRVAEAIAREWTAEVVAAMDQSAAEERAAVEDAEAEYEAQRSEAGDLVEEIRRGYAIAARDDVLCIQTPGGSWEPVGSPDDWLAEAERVPA